MNKKYFSIIFLVLLVLGLSFYIKNKREISNKESEQSINLNQNETASTTIVDLGNGIVAVGKGDFKVEKISGGNISNDLPQIDLERKIIFDSSVDSSVKNIILEKTEELKKNIKNNIDVYNSLLQIGLYNKMAGDYKGAIIYFEYVSKVYSTDYISYGNLGDIYGYYLKDVALSELNYNKAISNSPYQEYLYFQLASMFKDVANDREKALEVIERGLKALPKSKALGDFKNILK